MYKSLYYVENYIDQEIEKEEQLAKEAAEQATIEDGHSEEAVAKLEVFNCSIMNSFHEF